MRDGFIFHFEFINTEELTTEEVGILTLAMISYVQEGIEPDLDDRALRTEWKHIRQRLDADAEAYEQKCSQNRENGQKGGRPRKEETERFSEKPKKPNGYFEKPKKPDIDIESDIDTDVKKERSKREKRFTPPTLEEVRAYRSERGDKARDVDPETFIDFYESKGWKVGNQKMKDWKAAFRTWEKRDGPTARSGTKKNSFLNFPQREYDYDALERALVR